MADSSTDKCRNRACQIGRKKKKKKRKLSRDYLAELTRETLNRQPVIRRVKANQQPGSKKIFFRSSYSRKGREGKEERKNEKGETLSDSNYHRRLRCLILARQ